MSDQPPKNTQDRPIGSGALPRALSGPMRLIAMVWLRLAIPVGALCALSAAGLCVYASLNGSWMIAAFEAVATFAGVIAMLAGLGRFKRGPGLALLCSGGPIATLAILAEPALVTHLLGTEGHPLMVGSFKILPLMAARLGAGLFLAAGAAFVVWAREPARSAGYLIRAGITGGAAILIIVLGVWREPESGARPGVRGILDHAAGLLDGLPLLVQVVLVVAAFFLVIALVSGAGHCLIRSFEVGRLEDAQASENRRRDGLGGASPSAKPAGA